MTTPSNDDIVETHGSTSIVELETKPRCGNDYCLYMGDGVVLSYELWVMSGHMLLAMAFDSMNSQMFMFGSTTQRLNVSTIFDYKQ